MARHQADRDFEAMAPTSGVLLASRLV